MKLHSNVDLGLFLIRLAVGVVFITHGYGKLMNISGTTGFFSSIGIPMAEFFAWVVALVELIGGIALVLGLWVPVFGLLLAIIMFFAIVLVKWVGPNGGFSSSEFEIVLLFASLGIMFSGAGKCALDNKMFGKGESSMPNA